MKGKHADNPKFQPESNRRGDPQRPKTKKATKFVAFVSPQPGSNRKGDPAATY